MSAKFEYVIAETPSLYKFSGNQCLYNSKEYVDLWDDFTNITFLIVNSEKQKIDAFIHFQIKGNSAVSLAKAPFGSIIISHELDFEILSNFLNYVETHLKSRGVREIKIRHYPGIYYPQSNENVITTLALNGFTVSIIDINQIIEISSDPFGSIIHPMELRNLNKAKKEGIVFFPHGLNKLCAVMVAGGIPGNDHDTFLLAIDIHNIRSEGTDHCCFESAP